MHPAPDPIYLQPGQYMDSDAPPIVDTAHSIVKGMSDAREQAVALFYFVRDRYRYDPYRIDLRATAMKASHLLQRDYGYCVEKANLLGTLARALAIPSRLGFANVKNHIGTDKLEAFLGTNVLVFHGYTELFLEGRWVKATPAFNAALCHRLGVAPLEFDGAQDAIFQQFTADGRQFMAYLSDYGHFPDVPRDLFIAELQRHYPHLFSRALPQADWYFRFE